MRHGHNQEYSPLGFVILHNLMIKNDSNYKSLFDVGSNVSHSKRGLFFEDYCQGTTQIEDVATHYNFKNDLIKHLWAQKCNNPN